MRSCATLKFGWSSSPTAPTKRRLFTAILPQTSRSKPGPTLYVLSSPRIADGRADTSPLQRDRGYPDPILHEPANMPQVHDVNNRGQDADPDDMPCEPRFVLRDTTIALISPGLPGQPLDEDMFDVMSGMDSGDDGMEVVSDGGDPVQCHPRNTGFRAAYSGATKQDPGHAIAVRQPHTPDVAPKASRPVPKQAPPQVVVAHSHTRHVAAERPTGSTSSRSPAHGVALPCVTPCHGGTDNLGIAVGPSRSDGGATGQAKTRINSQDSVARYGSRSFAGTVFQNVSGPAVHSSQPLYISPPRSPTKGDSRRQGTRQQISEVGQARASMREELTTSTPTKRIQPFRATRLSKGAAKVRHRGRNALRRTRQGSQ